MLKPILQSLNSLNSGAKNQKVVHINCDLDTCHLIHEQGLIIHALLEIQVQEELRQCPIPYPRSLLQAIECPLQPADSRRLGVTCRLLHKDRLCQPSVKKGGFHIHLLYFPVEARS